MLHAFFIQFNSWFSLTDLIWCKILADFLNFLSGYLDFSFLFNLAFLVSTITLALGCSLVFI